MSAEPPVASGNNMSGISGAACPGSGATAGGINIAMQLHSFGSGGVGGGNQGSHATASRNMFPEYRYGREEMLSLFDRNCLLPQILPSFKKLFIDKVQYPLALTPSSEDEMNTQSPLGCNSRPSWLQRSAGGFGIPSRGSGRGGTVDRGRMRGKSSYHSMYQRAGAIYDDSVPAVSIKSERNWNERNGTGDSAAVGVTVSVAGGGSSGVGGSGLDWNGTPSSSPRKEFSNHNRNMENWRRNRNEDGSGDGPATAGGGTVGTEVSGWRSGSSHRWGRSTSWRDEDSIQGTNLDGIGFTVTAPNVQRSISVLATVGNERGIASGKASKSVPPSVGPGRQTGSKSNPTWPGQDVEDNLPEWAMENPSEPIVGGTFDSSGAFHGERDVQLHNQRINANKLPDESCTGKDESSAENILDLKMEPVPLDQSSLLIKPIEKMIQESKLQKECSDVGSSTSKGVHERRDRDVGSQTSDTSKSSPTHGDISERIKEVADEVEKLIMDDDNVDVVRSDSQKEDNPAELVCTGNDSVNGSVADSTTIYTMTTLPNTGVVDPGQRQQHQLLGQLTEAGIGPPTSGLLVSELAQKPLPFSDQVPQNHHRIQQEQPHLSGLSTHVINANANDLWFYRDPQSNVQGPFSAIEMTEWYRAGYFNENLFVRRFSDSRFRPLGELIKLCHGNMPFTHSHLLPSSLDLDNLPIPIIPQQHKPMPLLPSLNDQQQRSGPGSGSVSSSSPSIVDEQLKANVTAAADSLSAAIKGHLSAQQSIDTSHMLTMRFQMLQDQYLQHQEYQIISELSKNECFQRLDPTQREAIVRAKVQMLVLPEYLSSFSGLSNSLAALNPIAGNQLYDAIAQKAKNDEQQHLFQSGGGPPEQRPPRGNFLDANNFIVNAQLMHQQQTRRQAIINQKTVHPHPDPELNKLNDGSTDIGLLNEYNLRMLLRGPSGAGAAGQQHNAVVKPSPGVDFMTEAQLLASQSLMMPMWSQQQQQQSAQPWSAISNAKVTLWDVAALEEEHSQQKHNHLVTESQTTPTYPSSLNVTTQQQQQQQEQEQQQEQPQQGLDEEAQKIPQILHIPNQQQQQLSICKMISKQQTQTVSKPQEGKNQQTELKISDEERRRDQAEERRRLKEERKRQQLEEERRRYMQAEEEKSRQLQEEKERQQLIQTQRRKALLGIPQPNTLSSPASGSGSTTGIAVNSKQVVSKNEQQQGARAHGNATSVAPWSLQTVNVSSAPGLAEIQKAERRERRADQQRQQEQLDKQMRATAAAAAEANDALLKWQASPAPAPVMSLVDIQAEEAKRLANELLEQQRRRESEQQQQQTTIASNLNLPGSLSNIWGNATNKAWSATTASTIIGSGHTTSSGTSLWDNTKPAAVSVSAKHTPNLATSTAASVLSAGLPANITNSKPQFKPAVAVPSPRNLRKSQTLPAMQKISSKPASSSGHTQQHDKNNSKVGMSKANSKPACGGDDKKPNGTKIPHQSGGCESKISEYVNEFTIWCIKSLDNMSAKVDVPTFVAFLQDLEAPYEVKDYVRIYLGEGKESSDFSKQFLERRSKYKSLQRAQNAHNDDMCKPAPAITPSSNDNGEGKNKQKKIKKNKMTKMDARILGFSVTAAEGRINVGGRDYVDGP
ncbi:CG11148 [Drosophila busckii]|uniref:CG11148 n=1 Tax=Drosophila busckii TaxID=30019 RepID=A0A0M3QYS4_DROBS|nr:CG11148 [Drosophila busckii]